MGVEVREKRFGDLIRAGAKVMPSTYVEIVVGHESKHGRKPAHY